MTTANQSTDLAAVLARIAKIRNLAERGGTIDEQAVAAAKMQSLMLKYNVSLADLDRHAESSGRPISKDDYEMFGRRWMVNLLFTVADAHLCQALHTRGARKGGVKTQMVVIGHDHNLIVVRETWHWLRREIERLAKSALREALALGDWDATDKPYAWRNAFRAGAVVGVADAYQRMRRSVEEEVVGASSALVLVADEVAAVVGKLFPERGKLGGTKSVSLDPYLAGKDAGARINLDRQVGAAATAGVLS